MKIKNILSIATVATVMLPFSPVLAVPVPISSFYDSWGNAPFGSDSVGGVSGSGARASQGNAASFAPEIQSKVNAVGASLTVASISGSQTVGGNIVNVEPAVAQTAFDVISSSAGSDTTAVTGLVAALGGGESAQQLARSMQGMRGGDGAINPTVLSGAVTSYNSYLKSLIDSGKVTEKSTSELNNVVQSFPAGQKAAQVVLGKLVEAAR
jgi:hypothetical protein